VDSGELFAEKIEGQKSRDTVLLRENLHVKNPKKKTKIYTKIASKGNFKIMF
jgi:hypothetical protein